MPAGASIEVDASETVSFTDKSGRAPWEESVVPSTEISEEELLRRIIEYKKYKEITKKLRQMYNENSVRFYKLPDTIKLPKQKLEEKYEKQAIVSAYENVVRINNEKVNQNAQNIEKIAITDKYTVASKVKDILKELVKKPKFKKM